MAHLQYNRSDDLTTNAQLFVDDTSFFSILYNIDKSKINLNNDLNNIKIWATPQKMNCNPDPGKEVQKVIFSRKL